MDVNTLKEYLIDNECVEELLTSIGCHSIKSHGEYFTAANYDGDNKSAITIYMNDNITVVNYTRQMVKNKRATDIFDLVCYNEQCNFPEALKYVCNVFGLDYYEEPTDIPESLQILRLLREMSVGDGISDDTPIKPISKNILSYYLPYPNKMFTEDGISIAVQKEFNIGYDPYSNRITIPIYTELNDLCGIKGRYFGIPDEQHPKYLYLENCNKSKLLYGYSQNKSYIQSNNYLYIVESEKAVMQLATMGIRNCVSTGGKTISKTQIELIIRTGCTPIFAFDKDVEYDELKSIAYEFVDGINIYAIIDSDGILDEKESPSDNPNKFKQLQKNIQMIR